MINLNSINLSSINLGGLDLSEIKLGMPSGKGTGGETFDPASFDEAWTVTGKTNDDEDKAVIKNLTGNGNNLVLSNFAFYEDSGYGLYNQNFNNVYSNNSAYWAESDKTYKYVKFTSVNGSNANSSVTFSKFYKQKGFRFNLTSNVEGFAAKMLFYSNEQILLKEIPLVLGENIIPDLTDEEFSSLKSISPGITVLVSFNSGDWFALEQIPDYEGYLVTDGVDDRIISQSFNLGKDWTMVGEWILLEKNYSASGLVKSSSFFIYNLSEGIQIYVNSGNLATTLKGIRSLKAVCSDGRVYDKDWKEYSIAIGTTSSSSLGVRIGVSSDGTKFTSSAFKNLEFFNNRLLTKEQCIKAYNNLQNI